uniref:Uncharacterized protein n=1 Tax=Myotis myotis TaxID=51298 RepID=A0A7J7VYP5_MYOMY|nr:hypothetical protein mMyoMyo1_012325 [Myotis myotis]
MTKETWVHLVPRSKSGTPARNSWWGSRELSCVAFWPNNAVLLLQMPPQRKLGRPAAILGVFLSSSFLLASNSPSLCSPRKLKRTSVLSHGKHVILFSWHHHKTEQMPGSQIFINERFQKSKKSFQRIKREKKKLYHFFNPSVYVFQGYIYFLCHIFSV